MDFKKIEGIFLIAFLGLNLFLISLFVQSRSEESNLGSQEERDTIEVRLEKDKITYEGKLAKEKPQGYYLSAEETSYKVGTEEDETSSSLNQKTETFTEDILVNEDSLKEDVSAFLKGESSPLPNEYQYLGKPSDLKTDAPVILAGQSYENLPFYDDTAKMQLSLRNIQGKVYEIQSATYTHLDNIESLREKQDLISEADAVSTLYYNSKIPQETKINWMMLAYGRILKVREKNVYVPVWFVSLSAPDEKPRVEQVNAANNTIITGNTVPAVEN